LRQCLQDTHAKYINIITNIEQETTEKLTIEKVLNGDLVEEPERCGSLHWLTTPEDTEEVCLVVAVASAVEFKDDLLGEGCARP
jgi:hypothetical protein